MKNENSLDNTRKQINEIDRQMRELFIKRMRCAEAVAEYKKERGLAILDREREEQIIKNGSEAIEDEALRGYYIDFLRSNMTISRAYQYKLLEGMRVAYSGTEGAFAHIASQKLFPTARKAGYPDFASAYAAVESGECDIAVLPVENSSNGEVGQVTDLIFSGSLYITGMFELAITQDLLGVKGAALSDIKKVVSHPQALGQCSAFIEKHGLEKIEYNNTALAAKYVKELGDRSVAAIASREAAEIFGLELIDHDINAARNNTTRFAVLSKVCASHKTSDITSVVMFTVRNEAGALAKAVDVIGKYGFNMRSLRSRPMKELLWQYYFYVEAEGDIRSERGEEMMRELSNYCDKLKLAGSYKRH